MFNLSYIMALNTSKTTVLLQNLMKFRLSHVLLNINRLSSSNTDSSGGGACGKTEKLAKKLREKTPIGKLDELDEGKHPFQEKEPLPPWPDNTNPKTGEIGGPRGPEPTRYGDWERKGRVTDF